MGQIEESIILPFPRLEETEKETLAEILSSLDNWLGSHEKDFRKWDKESQFPESFLQEMRDFGLFGLLIPEESGGMGLKTSAYSRVIQEFAKYESSIGVMVGAHNSIGMRGLLLFGTDEQRKKYYPKIATGEMIAAFCLTEAGAGSDAASIKTKAVKDGDHWVLNGEKLWITNGGIASFFTVLARTDTEEGQITAFIVTKDMKGVTAGPHEDKLGIRASNTTTVHFDNVRVPQENILGEIGKGFKVAMKILNSGRTGLGGGCVGSMKQCIELATKFSKARVQFGKSISEYGLIQEKLGQMVVDCYTTESVVGMVAGLVDAGHEDYAVEAAISKVFASEALWRTADEALQISGGNGFMCEFPYEKILRDCRVNRIFEGTNEILRLFIALNGMNDVGKQLKELSSSLEGLFNEPIKGFGVLSDYALKRVSQATGVGGTKARFTKINPELSKQAAIFEECTRDLSAATDRLLRKHGKKIIGQQQATKNLADIMIDLFCLASVLSRVHSAIEKNGVKQSEKEIEILNIFASQVRRRIKRNLAQFDDNEDRLLQSAALNILELELFPWDYAKS
jgi:acyl-CoA dehydrogenase family protein 9